MVRTNSIKKFEKSLTEFLINTMADRYEDAKHYAYKFNNLKVYMDPSKYSEPHFVVSIGISEAVFAINNGNKISGGLGTEDGYVKRWSERANINNELRLHWKLIKDALSAEQEDDDPKKAMAFIKLKKAEDEESYLRVDMMGTGINTSKRLEKQRKESRFSGFKKKNTGTNSKKH
jgi:hypothetical protein